ncbi:unnamed protein product [Linum trigynum]|uniref:Uncharacterized protein n=1 Tax=Linum trigynum TaxID=586398 RepID=A0AAV2EC37_9ROSI
MFDQEWGFHGDSRGEVGDKWWVRDQRSDREWGFSDLVGFHSGSGGEAEDKWWVRNQRSTVVVGASGFRGELVEDVEQVLDARAGWHRCRRLLGESRILMLIC